jgi:translation elongation factor EF-Ts
LHNDLKQAAIIELDGVSQNDEIGNELAMHVVFAKPKYLSRLDVPSYILDKMNKEQMEKFFCTYCLLDQPYYHENDKTVEAILKAEHPDAKIKAFHLVIVGGENE